MLPILDIEYGTVGVNLQLGGGVTGLYVYRPVWDDYSSYGFAVGGSAEFNIAKGNGGWTGEFINDFLSYKSVSGSYFSSPDGSWKGMSAGYSKGAPIGYGKNTTYYYKLLGSEHLFPLVNLW